MQEIDLDYLRAMTALPDGWERLLGFVTSLMDERDTARAIAAAVVRDGAPLRKRVDQLLATNTQLVQLARDARASQ